MLGLLWLAGVAAVEALRPAGSDLSLCLFRNVTGLPCPTCGSTRAALAAMEGRFLDAVALNPLAVAAAAAVVAWGALRLARQRAAFTRPRGAIWAAIAVLAAVNWIWVMARETIAAS